METTARQFIIASLIFTAIITGMFTLIGQSVPTTSGNFTDYNRSYNKFVTIKSNAESISDRMETAQPSKEGDEGVLSGLWDISFGAVQQVWTSLTTMKAVIYDLNRGGSPFGMPNWFTGLLVIIISITIAFAIIASIRKWNT